MKNAFVLLIDAFMHEIVANDDAFRFFAPNLHALSRLGVNRKVVANAQATQFVMPSLFTATYPLDYGGYNEGIRDRPKSFVEVLHEAGYETFLLATANQLGLSLGYQRGFDVIGTTSDYRTQVEYRISRTMHYELDRYRKGVIDKPTVIARVKTLMMPLLDGLIEAISLHDRTIWPPGLMRLNQKIADNCAKEKRLLDNNPDAVLAKLLRVAPGLYWRYLGREHVGGIGFFVQRALCGLNWRTREKLSAQTAFPFLLLQHYQAIAGDVIPATTRFITAPRSKNWFVHMHLMDLHDCRAANRFGHVVGLFRYFPKWLAARLRGLTGRRFLYDATLMYLDRQLASLLAILTRQVRADETVIIVTGDHGSQYARSPRAKPPIGERMYGEHIDVGFIFAGDLAAAAGKDGMLDTMGVSDTLLRALDVDPHPSFKGRGLQAGGRDVIVSESCGRGFSDLKEGDLFFAVSSPTHRLFLCLKGQKLRAEKLFEFKTDPDELDNILAAPGSRDIVNALAGVLFRERADLLRTRGVSLPDETEIVMPVR